MCYCKPTNLGRNHGTDFGEDHMTGKGEQDVVTEGGEPHCPLKVSHVLKTENQLLNYYASTYCLSTLPRAGLISSVSQENVVSFFLYKYIRMVLTIRRNKVIS